jgi:hypothetical protein
MLIATLMGIIEISVEKHDRRRRALQKVTPVIKIGFVFP